MKLFLCITFCCLTLGVESQFDYQQQPYYKQSFRVLPLSGDPNEIYYEDSVPQISSRQANNQPIVNQQPSTQNTETQGIDAFGQSVNSNDNSNIGTQSNFNQGVSSSAASSNPANLNSWNQESIDNSGASNVAQNLPSNTQTNVNNGAIDLSIFSKQKVEQNQQNNVPSQTGGAGSKDFTNIFGVRPPSTASTLDFVEPRIQTIGSAVTRFGVNLMQTISNVDRGNVVISPFSISSCMVLLQQGANGNTQEQISNTLQISPQEARKVYKAIADDIKKRDRKTESSNLLKIANNIYTAENFALNTTFSKIAKEELGSAVTPTNFQQPALAVRDINNWVSTYTNGKIQNLVSQNDIGYTTQMALINAVYFKGLWDIPFSERKTKTHEFYLSDGRTKMTSFMRSRRTLRAGVDPANNNAKIMILPFQSNEYSLMWLLPSENSNISELIRSLNAEQLLDYRNFPEQEIDVEIPKFTIRADINLIPVLKTMGVQDLFSDFSDLSGIGNNKNYLAPLQVSSAVHSAVLSIDEHGGSAAAATSFGVVALSYAPPLVFKANRPFLVLLWDHASAVPLFIAKIEEPLEISQ